MRYCHSTTALSKLKEKSAWPNASKGAIGKPRSPKRRRSRQLLRLQVKRPPHGSRQSAPEKRNSKTSSTSTGPRDRRGHTRSIANVGRQSLCCLHINRGTTG